MNTKGDDNIDDHHVSKWNHATILISHWKQLKTLLRQYRLVLDWRGDCGPWTTMATFCLEASSSPSRSLLPRITRHNSSLIWYRALSRSIFWHAFTMRQGYWYTMITQHHEFYVLTMCLCTNHAIFCTHAPRSGTNCENIISAHCITTPAGSLPISGYLVTGIPCILPQAR